MTVKPKRRNRHGSASEPQDAGDQRRRPRSPSVAHPPQSQDCPACGGIMPPTAITIGPWEPASLATGIECVERFVAMLCPHCGHRDRHRQRNR